MDNVEQSLKRRATDVPVDHRAVLDMDQLKTFIFDQNKELQENINKKLQETIEENKSNIKSLELNLDKKLDSFAGYVNSKIEGVRAECMDTINAISDEVNGKIRKFSDNVEDRLDYLERQSKLCDVIVKNIPYHPDENMRNFVYGVCDGIGYKNIDAIKAAFRMSKHQKRSNPIVFKFYDKGDRRDFMSAYFSHQNLNLGNLGFKTKLRVVISEALTQKNSEIFKKAMQLKFGKVFASVSTRNGFVFYRLDPKAQPTKISSILSLDTFFSTGANASNESSDIQIPKVLPAQHNGDASSSQSMVNPTA